MSVIKNLKKNYDDFQIQIESMELKDQGVTALVGPSGSGKTSILRILSGLEDCPSLEWMFQGRDLAQTPVQKRKIGFVFQNLELFPHMTAQENIQFAGQCSNSPSWKTDLKFLIKSLGIEHCRQRRSDQLSGGEQQRTALARALITKPQILFLDEPFSSLDYKNKTLAIKVVKEMVQHYNIPALLVSHDKEDIFSLSHTIIHIEQGQLKKIENRTLFSG